MSSSPLVSVLVPAYNAEPWLAETLTSVLGQTYPHLEITVVDDGSSDGTLAVARSFEERGVRVVPQENAGACAARNRALQGAAGDYVQYLDADDLLSPEKIERQVELLEGAPAGCVAVCGTVYFDDGTDPAQGQRSPGYPALNSDDPVQWLLDLWTPGPGYGTTRWGMVQPNAWLVPRAVADEAGAWDERLTVDDDGEYFTRVLLASFGVRWAPEGWNYYRKFNSGGSLSNQRSKRHCEDWLLAVEQKAQHVLPQTTDQNRAQARACLARQYMDVAYHAHPRHPGVVRRAERKAAELGGYGTTFMRNTRLESLERLAGWKAAKHVSYLYHKLKSLRERAA
jgi:glycosyltransferase involved in cell wall biosynthesis